MARPRVSSRRYSDRTLKILWGRAAGRCAMPECRIEVLLDDSDHDPIIVIGDVAHVEASSDAGPRGNQGGTILGRDEYDNLVLLCKNCHAKIDGQKTKFTVSKIQSIKAAHEAWVRSSLPERGLNRTGWTVVLLQGEHPIDLAQAACALEPDFTEGDPRTIEVSRSRENWPELHDRIASSVRAVLDQRDMFSRRFAVFPLAPVSACIALGYHLTDRPRVKLFQYHRHASSWVWGPGGAGASDASVVGMPSVVNRKRGELIVCFAVSAAIDQAHYPSLKSNALGTIRLHLPIPSTRWLRSEAQLDALGARAQDMLESALRQYPNATCWHLLAAVPAPAAVKIGQAMNPSMTPPVQLYEFTRSATPAYARSIRLDGAVNERR